MVSSSIRGHLRGPLRRLAILAALLGPWLMTGRAEAQFGMGMGMPGMGMGMGMGMSGMGGGVAPYTPNTVQQMEQRMRSNAGSISSMPSSGTTA